MTAPDQTPDDPEAERARIARLQAELQLRMRDEERRKERERDRLIIKVSRRLIYVLALVILLAVPVYGLLMAYPLQAMITVPMILLAALFIYEVLVRFDDMADQLERIERRLPAEKKGE